MLNELFQVLIERIDFFGELVVQHILLSFSTILIAGVIGLAIGILISENQKLASPIIGLINIIYTIPSISFLGLLIPLTGIGNTTAVIVLSVYALLPMVRNTYTGITNIDGGLIEAAYGMGSTKSQVLALIKLPLALPVIISGLRNMIVMTISLAGIASFIGAGGLGVSIYRGITTNNASITIIGSLLIAFLAVLSDTLVGIVETLIKRRRRI